MPHNTKRLFSLPGMLNALHPGFTTVRTAKGLVEIGSCNSTPVFAECWNDLKPWRHCLQQGASIFFARAASFISDMALGNNTRTRSSAPMPSALRTEQNTAAHHRPAQSIAALTLLVSWFITVFIFPIFSHRHHQQQHHAIDFRLRPTVHRDNTSRPVPRRLLISSVSQANQTSVWLRCEEAAKT